jgi:SAM-dependent methyltransferase
VPHDELTHEQRDRAESFGAVAAAYDTYRPSYPAALIDDLMASGPADVLDIGCGTGKAARLFADRGARVLGVEIDAGMAAVARGHGLSVEIAAFEDWDDRGRRFDLITCAQAWHWVDPAVAGPKAARLLRPDGMLALFWNIDQLAPEVRTVVEEVYQRVAPELVEPRDAGDDQTHLRALQAAGGFATIEAVTYPGDRVWPVDEWIGNVGTQSNHLLLGPRLAAVLDALRTALVAWGGELRTTGGTYLIRAQP